LFEMPQTTAFAPARLLASKTLYVPIRLPIRSQCTLLDYLMICCDPSVPMD